jgi:hypothetical protein
MRLDNLRAKFDELKIDTLYVTQGRQPPLPERVHRFVRRTGHHAHALIMTDSRYWQQAEQQTRDFS